MIHILDDVIGPAYSQYLFEQTVNLGWTFVPNLSTGQADNYDHAGFSHVFYTRDRVTGTEKESERYDLIRPLLLGAFDRVRNLDNQLSFTLEQVFRCRARLTLNKPQSVRETVHRDYSFPHWVLLYYVNTTDGDTLIYDAQNREHRISPQRGRCVFFDGGLAHASSNSTASPRIVINTNIIFSRHHT